MGSLHNNTWRQVEIIRQIAMRTIFFSFCPWKRPAFFGLYTRPLTHACLHPWVPASFYRTLNRVIAKWDDVYEHEGLTFPLYFVPDHVVLFSIGKNRVNWPAPPVIFQIGNFLGKIIAFAHFHPRGRRGCAEVKDSMHSLKLTPVAASR